MRALALGWLAGAAWLQTQPALPSNVVSLWLLGLGLGLATWLVLRHRAQPAPEAVRPLRTTGVSPLARALPWLLAGLLAGAGWSGWQAQRRMADELPPLLEGRDLQLTGVVASLPDDAGHGQRFLVQVEHASLHGQTVRLPRRLSLGWYDHDTGDDNAPVSVKPGERWQWTVRLKRPHGLANPGGFDDEAWLLSEGIRATGYVRPGAARRIEAFVISPRDAVGRVREALRERLMASLPEARHAGVIVALVIGDQRGIEAGDRALFNLTGIGHLVSISGLHITMIAALVALAVGTVWRHALWRGQPLALRLPAQQAGTLAGLLAALAYVALAGFGVPAQRTLLMLAVVAVALYRARRLPVSRVLATALLAVLVADPWAPLWPGFWLSFGAIACILFASAGRAADHARGGEERGWRAALRRGAHTQATVTLGLVPLTMALFGQVSLLSPLANAIAIPLVSFVVTPLALLGSVLPQPLCRWLLSVAHECFAALVSLLHALLDLAGEAAIWQAPRPDMLTLSVALTGTAWLLAPRGWPWRWAGALAWMPMLLAQPSAPGSGFHITAIDVGQGNAVLVETAHHRLLYDTGPAYPSGSDAGGRVILPYLRARGIGRLDGLMLSHADSDHAGGAASVLVGMPVGWTSSSLAAPNTVLRGLSNHVGCVAGQHWFWDGVHFELLHPLAADHAEARTNARSCVLRVSAGGQAVLLAGDIERAQERALLARSPDKLAATVLLAPHHGSGTSSTAEFLDAVAPQWAVFQVGYRNRYRHPKPEVLARYRQRGIRWYRSDQDGAVQVRSGLPLQVTSYRCEQPRYWRQAACDAGKEESLITR